MAIQTPSDQLTRHSTITTQAKATAKQQHSQQHSRHVARHRRLTRGQAIVEFALVAPLFFAMIFGLVEFSLISASVSTFNFAAKDSARIGSLLGRTDGTVDQQIVTDIRNRTAGIVLSKATTIEVFHSDVTGQPITSGGNIVENVYDIQGNLIGSAGWPVATRHDQLLDADYLGVRITYQYTYLTGFISGGNPTLQLVATSVQRIEPQDYQVHRPPQPITIKTITMATIQQSQPSSLPMLLALGLFITPILTPTADRPRRPRGFSRQEDEL